MMQNEQDGVLVPYPDETRREALIAHYAQVLGGEVVTFGESVQGRPLQALRIPCLSETQTPRRVLLCANIHGVELITTYIALGFLKALETPTPAMESLRREAEIWVIASLNPDGYARTYRQDGIGVLEELRTNARGVDLNRNYPLPGGRPWFALALGGWGTGSAKYGNAFFRGEHPLSEPETASLDALCHAQSFHASANLHSCMGTMFPAHVKTSQEFEGYRTLCRAFQRGQAKHRYLRVASRVFDWFTGEQEDHQHHVHGTWATCIEIFPWWATYLQHLYAPSLFWRFNPRNPEIWVQNDVPGLVSYFAAALQLPSPRELRR